MIDAQVKFNETKVDLVADYFLKRMSAELNNDHKIVETTINTTLILMCVIRPQLFSKLTDQLQTEQAEIETSEKFHKNFADDIQFYQAFINFICLTVDCKAEYVETVQKVIKDLLLTFYIINRNWTLEITNAVKIHSVENTVSYKILNSETSSYLKTFKQTIEIDDDCFPNDQVYDYVSKSFGKTDCAMFY